MTSPGSSLRPHRAVVLAAGRGTRLGAGPAIPPKPLVPLNGRPLIDYALDALAASGIREVLVVTGYREDEVRAAILPSNYPSLHIHFVSNPAFQRPASTSLRAARLWCADEPFLLLMSDHVPSATFVQSFLNGARPGVCSVATDFSHHEPAYVEEATRIALVRAFPGDDRVAAIGKGLPRWDALDAGAFLLQPSAWDAVYAAPEYCELSVIFSLLARDPGLHAVDVSGAFWYDIDTDADLAAAAALLTEQSARPTPAQPREHSPTPTPRLR